jgi:hypothetical protein
MKNLLLKSRVFLLLLCGIIITTIELRAQTYYPLPTQNAYWTVYEWDENRLVYDDLVYTVNGDTILNNLQYTKVYKLNDHPTIFDTIRTLHCFMRQDNEAKKIWFIRHYLGETSEKLGYDLSANLGDTVSLPAHAYEWDQDSLFILYIADTNSVPLYNGQHRNYYSFSSINNNGRSIGFVEGITAFDNTFPDRYFFWDAFHQSYTMCMHENGKYLWPANGWPIDTTYCGFNLVYTKDYEKDAFLIYPNPANNFVNIDLPADFAKGSIELTDLMGNQLTRINFYNGSNQIHLDLTPYPSGVYFFITRTHTSTFYNKLIINH